MGCHIYRDDQHMSEPSRARTNHDGRTAHPNSTVHAICAPAMDMLRVMRSQVDSLRLPGGELGLPLLPFWSLGAVGVGSTCSVCRARAAGQGIWLVGSSLVSPTAVIMVLQKEETWSSAGWSKAVDMRFVGSPLMYSLPDPVLLHHINMTTALPGSYCTHRNLK
jgi:hypothetical protein